MLKIFWGIALTCVHFGGYLQFAAVLAGAALIASGLYQMKERERGFFLGFVSAILLAAYMAAGAILYRMPIYETGLFSNYLYSGKIVLISLLLLMIFSAIKNTYGARPFGLIVLMIMNISTAAAVMLDPIFHFSHDEITIGMAILVYAFVLGYVFIDMRSAHLAELDEEF